MTEDEFRRKPSTDPARPETFDRLTIRVEYNGYVIRGDLVGKPSGNETHCWVARDGEELVALVRRLVAEPREGRTS